MSMLAFRLSSHVRSHRPFAVTKISLLPSAPESSGQTSVAEKVMAGIRAMLIAGELAPGTRIDQLELSRRFGVSIVPIREALARLASAGLVEILSHRGVFVAQVSAEELVDLYTVRELLEEQAARLAVELLSEDDLEALDGIADAMEGAAKKKNGGEFLRLNRELHFTLYRATKRRHMLQIIEQMWDLSARYAQLQLHVSPGRAAQSIAEVRTIVAACRRRDRDEVGLMVRYKVHQTSVALLERMKAAELPAKPSTVKPPRSKRPPSRKGRRGA